jgi:hypothetical protein
MEGISQSRIYIFLLLLGIFTLFSTPDIFAQTADHIIDLDGTGSVGRGNPAVDQQVASGDTLTPWGPLAGTTVFPPPGSEAGLDWFDRDDSKSWTIGLDDLHSEALANCPTANGGVMRNEIHDIGQDCPVLDLDGNLGLFAHPARPSSVGPSPQSLPPLGGDVVDCDLETGGSPSFQRSTTAGQRNLIPPYGFPSGTDCQDTRANFQLAFHDANNNKFWDDGEDIVLDTIPLGIFNPPTAVGGKFLDIDKTALVLAGTHYTTSWVIPALVAAIGFGLVLARKI